MALPRARPDLWGVYTNHRFHRLVRAPAAHYGDPAPREESFPAEAVLRDLATADTAAAPIIAARYAALRFWLLRGTGEAPTLVEHAREAAREQLAAGGDPSRTSALQALVESPEPLRKAVVLLEQAAGQAERARQPHGAGALRESGFRMAVLHLDFTLASRIAADIGSRLRRAGDRDAATRWERAAESLAARRNALRPPSPQ